MIWMVCDKQMTNASSGTRTRDVHSSSVVAQRDSHAYFNSLHLKMVGKNFSPCVCVVLVYTCFSANARTNASARFEKYSNPLVDVCVCVEVVHSRFFFFYSNTFASMVWISRASVFCVFITGARDVFKVKSPDEVFDTLERLLWDHANKVWK